MWVWYCGTKLCFGLKGHQFDACLGDFQLFWSKHTLKSTFKALPLRTINKSYQVEKITEDAFWVGRKAYLEHDYTCQNCKWCKHNIVYRRNNSSVESIERLHRKNQKYNQMRMRAVTIKKTISFAHNQMTSDTWNPRCYLIQIHATTANPYFRCKPQQEKIFELLNSIV